jgi:hypothetical protein
MSHRDLARFLAVLRRGVPGERGGGPEDLLRGVKTFSHFLDSNENEVKNVKIHLHFSPVFLLKKIGEKKFKSFTKFSTEKLKMFNQC